MEDINKFSKGVNYDTGIIQNPPDTATLLENWVQISENGYMFSLQNEKGPLNVNTVFPTGFKVIGACILNNDIIVCLAHPDGYSQIGFVDYSGIYNRVVPNIIDVNGDINSELGLDLNYPVDCQSRKLIKGDRILYYTDNHTPFSAINLDQIYITGDIKDNIKIIPNVNNAIIDLKEIIENQSGDLTAGVYQFFVQYQTASNNWTNPSIPSNIIPLVPFNRSVGRNKYEGGSSTTVVNKSISLNITNLDQSFTAFRVVAIRFEGNTNTFSALTSSVIPITSTSYNYIYNGSSTDSLILTKEEVSAFNITYNTAKCIEQKDQTLILSNLTEATGKFDHILQDIANNITVKYKITEQEYLEGNNLSPSFASVGFSIVNEGDMSIKGLFNSAVSTTVSPSDIDIIIPANRAYATVTITNYTNLSGDTLNINGTVFTAQATPATPGTATFQYSVSNANTALSLYNQINAYTFSPRPIIALLNNNIVTIIDQATGTAGNSDTLVYTDGGTAGLTISGATFTGGTNSSIIDPISIEIDSTNNYQYIITTSVPIYSYYGVYVNSVSSVSGDTYTTPIGTTEPITEGSIVILQDNIALGISNYKDEYNTFSMKGYRRSERYSLGIAGELKENSYTFNYHIAGNNKMTATSTAAIPDSPGTLGNSEGVCGTYVSTVEYPLNQFYPGNLSGDDVSSGTTNRFVKHHVMPSLEQEPSFRKVGDKLYIRILSLKLVFNKAFTPELIESLQSYYITRQSRDGDSNTSVFAQGMINRFVESTLDYDSSTGAPSGDIVKRKMPGFNNTTVSVSTFNPPGTAGSKPSAGFGFYNPTNKEFVFNSPDTLFERISAEDLQGLIIKAEQKLTGSTKNVAFNPSIYNVKSNAIGTPNTVTKLKLYPRIWNYVQYDNYATVSPEGGKVVTTNIVESKKIDYGTTTNVAAFTEDLYNSYSEQNTFIATSDQLNLGIGNSLQLFIETVDSGITDRDITNNDGYILPTTITNNIYNIYSNNVSQYGTVSSANYVPVKRIAVSDTNFPHVGDSIQVYNGDTFISRFAYSNKDNFQYKPYKLRYLYTTGISFLNYEYNGSGVPDTMIDATGYDMRSLSYFFVESNINAEYRHQFVDPVTADLGPTFYPKETDYNTLKTDPRVGEPNSYNTQYSFENRVKLFFNKSFDFDVNNRFENRSIYSQRANLDDITDYYKEFPINNYHDIPSNTGPIWDSFVYDNILYLHTPKALWRTYFNNNTFIPASDVSEVILGTGKEFNRPSETIFTNKGGYGGTISQYGGTITSFGYVFIDALQGKVFLLADGLSELSDQGAITFFRNIGNTLKLGDTFKDNPFYGEGITSGYDSDLRRLMITKIGTEGFTISYSLLSQSWMGTHTYYPNCYISKDKDTFVFNNTDTVSLWQLNKGEFNNYFGTIFPSILEYSLSYGYDASKVFTNIIIDNQIKENGVNKIGTFTTIQCYNDFQNTGFIPIIVNNTVVPNYNQSVTQVKYLNKEYRLRIPRDSVIDPTQDIFNNANLNVLSSFKKKIKGKWCKVRLEFNNPNNYEFILNFVKSIFDQNFR